MSLSNHQLLLTLIATMLASCTSNSSDMTDGATGPSSGPGSTTSTPTTGSNCAVGEVACSDQGAQSCDPNGVFGRPIACPAACIMGIGCVDCEPGTTRCFDTQVEQCNELGEWVPSETCDTDLGLTCDLAKGGCVGECLPETLIQKGKSHIGCDFFQTSTTINAPNNEALGVFVTNIHDTLVTVRAERPPWAGSVVEVAAHDTARIILTADSTIVAPGGKTVVSPGGAFHLKSTRPVIVTQHNPILAGPGDASLLLPVTSWDVRYMVASYSGPEIKPGIYYEGAYLVVAVEDATHVEIAAPLGLKVHPGSGIGADGAGELILSRGDVLQVLAEGPTDLTGSFVTADKPVQVLGAHRCARVPSNVDYCEHIEESMMPMAMLGKSHPVVPPSKVGDPAVLRAQVIRVVASKPQTALTFMPEVAPPTLLEEEGDFFEVGPTAEAFIIESSEAVLVVQYMLGSEWDGEPGGPSMTLATSSNNFVKEHWFHTNSAWGTTDVTIVAPEGAVVQVDGAPMDDWTQIGTSTFVFGHLRFDPKDNGGTHTIVADVPIGASVYALGAGDFRASYWHPAGYSLLAQP